MPAAPAWAEPLAVPGLTEGAAQVSQDGIRLVQGEVSILELGELPIQLGGVGHGSVRDTELSCPLLKGCPTCLGAVTHAGGLEWALQPALHGYHLLLPALVLVGQQHAHGLAAP